MQGKGIFHSERYSKKKLERNFSFADDGKRKKPYPKGREKITSKKHPQGCDQANGATAAQSHNTSREIGIEKTQ